MRERERERGSNNYHVSTKTVISWRRVNGSFEMSRFYEGVCWERHSWSRMIRTKKTWRIDEGMSDGHVHMYVCTSECHYFLGIRRSDIMFHSTFSGLPVDVKSQGGWTFRKRIINFSLDTRQIRDTFLPYICVCVCVSLLFILYKNLP